MSMLETEPMSRALGLRIASSRQRIRAAAVSLDDIEISCLEMGRRATLHIDWLESILINARAALLCSILRRCRRRRETT